MVKKRWAQTGAQEMIGNEWKRERECKTWPTDEKKNKYVPFQYDTPRLKLYYQEWRERDKKRAYRGFIGSATATTHIHSQEVEEKKTEPIDTHIMRTTLFNQSHFQRCVVFLCKKKALNFFYKSKNQWNILSWVTLGYFWYRRSLSHPLSYSLTHFNFIARADRIWDY